VLCIVAVYAFVFCNMTFSQLTGKEHVRTFLNNVEDQAVFLCQPRLLLVDLNSKGSVKYRCISCSRMTVFLLRSVVFSVCLYQLPSTGPGTGFPRLLESPGFFCKISRPWKVLENGFGPGKSWNFLLGYDAGGRHNGVGVGAAGA